MSARPGPPQLGVVGRVLVGALLGAGAIVATPSIFGLLWFIPYAGVGAMLAIRRPGTSIGWLLLALGWCLALTTTTVDATTVQQFADGTVHPSEAFLGIAQFITGTIGFYLVSVLAVVLPAGHLPAGRWRPITRLILAAGMALVIVAIFMPVIKVNPTGYAGSVAVPNPVAVMQGLPLWTIVTPETVVIANAILLAAATTSLMVRGRRAVGIERQQLRWITSAIAFVVVAVLGGFVVASLVPGSGDSGLAWVGAVVAFPSVPIAIGIAVLRYRLYEIDRIISRSIGWALVTGVLVAVFAGGVLALQAILAGFTQGQTLAVAASTLVAFALFQPVRRRVQRAVDRRFDRARYDAERTAAAFAELLRDETDIATVTADLTSTTRSALAPTALGIWLRQP